MESRNERREAHLAEIEQAMKEFGGDILSSPGMRISMNLPQHGTVTVYLHSVGVAWCSLRLAQLMGIEVDEKALVRGALLHDYFLYDSHMKERWHRFHWLRHPAYALDNALRDFQLTPREQEIIRRHMFPLTPVAPRCREAAIVCLADKFCAFMERMDRHYIPEEVLETAGSLAAGRRE